MFSMRFISLLLLVIVCSFLALSCLRKKTEDSLPLANINTSIKQIAGGLKYSLILTKEGLVYSVGTNESGALGLGDLKNGEKMPKITQIPQPSFDNKVIVSVAVSVPQEPYNSSSYALTSEGDVYSWGNNSDGQLGLGDEINRNKPEKINFKDAKIKKITAGERHFLALDEAGVLYAFGVNVDLVSNDLGILGVGPSKLLVVSPKPVILTNLGDDKIKDMQAGSDFSLILTEAGDIYTWGSNGSNQLGHNVSTEPIMNPTKIDRSKFANEEIDKAVAYGSSVIVRTKSGKFYGWGGNISYQLGFVSKDSNAAEPKLIQGSIFDDNLADNISLSLNSAFALTKSGEIYSWGTEYGNGMLGQGKKANDYKSAAPVKISGGMDGKVVSLFAAPNHVFALTETNKLYSWGKGSSAQRGDGIYLNKYTPSLVDLENPNSPEKLADVKEISAGNGHSLALTNKNVVFVWGDNNVGQLGVEDLSILDSVNTPLMISSSAFDNKTVVSLSTGKDSSYVLTSEGDVYSWGYNYDGQLCLGDMNDRNTPKKIDFKRAKIIKMAAGERHFLALDDKGKLYACGYNGDFLQYLGADSLEESVLLPTPVLLDNLDNDTIKDVKAADWHSVILTQAGDIYTWGSAYNNQLGLGEGLEDGAIEPTKIDNSNFGGKAVTKVAADGLSTFVFAGVGADTKIYTWGNNLNNQLSLASSNPYELSPVELAGGIFNGGIITDIYTAGLLGFALTKSGDLYSWGSEGYSWISGGDYVQDGKLGQGKKDIEYQDPTPVKILDRKDGKVTKVYTSGSSSFALTDKGKIYVWGMNDRGQLGTGDTENRLVPTLLE